MALNVVFRLATRVHVQKQMRAVFKMKEYMKIKINLKKTWIKTTARLGENCNMAGLQLQVVRNTDLERKVAY